MPLFTIQHEFRYDIVRKIFEGGMGVVYEAEQRGARDFVKRVAIKVIRSHYASQKTYIDTFIGEAKLVADLIHTNIVQTYQLGEGDVMWVPKGTAHWFPEIPEALGYLLVKVFY